VRHPLRKIIIAAGVALALLATPLAAQRIPSKILTLDQSRFFNQSAFGQRVMAEIKTRSARLTAENRRIEDTLKAEELSLTVKRKTLPTADFRVLADAFDAKVERIRTARAKKTVALNKWAETERQRFIDTAYPELLKLANQLGALVILDQRQTIITSSKIDVTAKAIARINETIGDGTAKPDAAPTPPDAAPKE